MKRLFASVVFVALLAAVPAIAASPPPVSYSWTGCYLGGNAGFALAHNSWFDPQLAFDSGENSSSGAVAGGQAGCDYQKGNFVFGAQGLFDWTYMKGSHLYTGDPLYNDINRASWIATLTGRIGYAAQPATLIYLKGGAAFVRNKFTEECNVLGAGCPGEAKTVRTGWTAGGGVEYRLAPMWSVFAEYNYMDLGRKTSTLSYNNSSPYDYTIKQTTQAVLLGINYRFGGLH
jgi:outer membrane immunogenic protein